MYTTREPYIFRTNQVVELLLHYYTFTTAVYLMCLEPL